MTAIKFNIAESSDTPVVNTSSEVLSMSVESMGNLSQFARGAHLGQPVHHRLQFRVQETATDRIRVDNLNYFERYADGFFNGGTADVYVVNNGARTLLTSATITATKVNLEKSLGFVTDTRFEWAWTTSSNRPSSSYWFSVAAIDASGLEGARSSWVTYTSPTSGSDAASNPTSTTVTVNGTGGLAAPTGVAGGAKAGAPAVAEITWNSVANAVAYRVYLSWQDPTLNVADEYLDIDTSGQSIPLGAVVIVTRLALTPSGKWCSRVWRDFASYGNERSAGFTGFFSGETEAGTNGTWTAYTGGDPAPTGIDGEYFYRRPVSGAADLAEHYFHAGNARTNEFYYSLIPNRDYKVRFLLRADANVTLTINVEGVTTGSSGTFNVTTSWAWYEHTFSRTSTAGGASSYRWRLTAPGACTVDFAAFETIDSTLDVWDLPSEDKALVPSGIFLRDHTQIKPGFSTSSMRQILSRTGQAATGNTLYAHLQRCKANSLKPWIQIEWHLSHDEWLDFVAYMAAPAASGHPMADLRVAQGQTAPWVDEFSKVILEFGNEAWNTVGEFWSTNRGDTFRDQTTSTEYNGGQTFGLHVQGLIDVMKTSAYWSDFRTKTLLHVGGQGASAAYEQGILDYATDVDLVGLPAYNGGWETTSTVAAEDGATFSVLLQQYSSPTFWQSRRASVQAEGADLCIYEAGPGYLIDGFQGSSLTAAQQIVQEVVAKSRAMGTATVAAFGIRAAGGIQYDNFFRLQRDFLWTSHSSGASGGGTYMSIGLLKLIWEAVGPSRVEKLTTVYRPKTTQNANIEALQAFEFRSLANAANRVIAVCNRDIDVSLLEAGDPLYSATATGLYRTVVNTSIASCTGLSYYANVGNFRQHNKYPVGFRRNPSTGALDVADSLCVAFTYSWTSGTALTNARQITIDDTYGANAGGLPAGNCVLLKLTGCVGA